MLTIRRFDSPTPRRLPRLGLWLLLAFACVIAHGTESGIAARDLDLLAEPRGDARAVGKVAKDARFELLASERFWVHIAAGGQQGWVQRFYLSWGAAPAASPAPGRVLMESLGLATRQRQGSVTATLGVRGIDEEQLKLAQFNAAELQRLDALRVPRPVADGYALEGRLLARKLDYLADPAGADAKPRRAAAP